MGRLFGTDGIRGVANTELTCELALDVGRAAAAVLAEGYRRRPVFVVGTDTRTSAGMLASALMAGLCSVGADVMYLQVISTPAVAYLMTKYKADAGIMISASHNPSEYNGIKIFGGNGYKLPDALEERIEDIVLNHLPIADHLVGDAVGTVTYCNDCAKDYIAHLRSTVPNCLEGLRVGVDCANGSASVTARELFESLGAEVHIINDRPNGSNINNNCGSTHMEELIKTVRDLHLDCGVAFDGDADRCLAVDENGALIDGDMIMAVCALDMKKRGKLNHDAVVGTIMTNFGFGKFCEENGLKFVATKVGDRFVLEEMLMEDYSFGGEQSGHVIFRDFATTGDGQLTAIQLLSMLKREGCPLSALTTVMRRYPQTIINVKVTNDSKRLFYTDTEISRVMNQAKDILGTDGRIVVRPSGTEPLIRVMAEGSNEDIIAQQANMVAQVIQNRLGV